MSATFLARLMVSAVAAGQGISPLFIDLNRTHATNPLWSGHARFHVVWQTLGLFFLGVIGVALIWLPSPESRLLFYLAALLTALPMLSFLVAMLCRRAYGGTLHDPNGIQPVRIRIGAHMREFDMNAVLVIFGGVVLAAAVALF
ncbi:MAG: DUF6640 family protein [Terracidiphilus sp.]